MLPVSSKIENAHTAAFSQPKNVSESIVKKKDMAKKVEKKKVDRPLK